jgi:hypothetical protein
MSNDSKYTPRIALVNKHGKLVHHLCIIAAPVYRVTGRNALGTVVEQDGTRPGQIKIIYGDGNREVADTPEAIAAVIRAVSPEAMAEIARCEEELAAAKQALIAAKQAAFATGTPVPQDVINAHRF